MIVDKCVCVCVQSVNEEDLELVLECIQRTPKSIELDINGSILSMGATATGSVFMLKLFVLSLHIRCTVNCNRFGRMHCLLLLPSGVLCCAVLCRPQVSRARRRAHQLCGVRVRVAPLRAHRSSARLRGRLSRTRARAHLLPALT